LTFRLVQQKQIHLYVAARPSLTNNLTGRLRELLKIAVHHCVASVSKLFVSINLIVWYTELAVYHFGHISLLNNIHIIERQQVLLMLLESVHVMI